MHKLAVLTDPALVNAALHALDEEHIPATTTEDAAPGVIHVGGYRTIIWVPDGTDLDHAREIVDRIQRGGSSDRCPDCGYDLTAHHGPTTCPECGHAVHGPEIELVCPACGEHVPSSFATCWSCGGVMRDARPAERPPEALATRGGRGPLVSFVLFYLVAPVVTVVLFQAMLWANVPRANALLVVAALAAVVLIVLVTRSRH